MADENPFEGRKIAAIVELDQEAAGASQVAIVRPTANDFMLMMEGDQHTRVMRLFPAIVAPAEGDKPTGKVLTEADISGMMASDVAVIDDAIMQILDLEELENYEADGEIYELRYPVKLDAETVVKRLEFKPKKFGEMRSVHKAKDDNARVRAMFNMARDPDHPELPISANLLFKALDGADMARIMHGHFPGNSKASNAGTKLRLL